MRPEHEHGTSAGGDALRVAQTAQAIEATQRAYAAYAANDRVGAEASCRDALAADPDSFDALHLLGALASQGGRAQEAVTLLQRAIVVRRNDAAVQNSLGNALRLAGRQAEALPHYERAIELAPDFAAAHDNRGLVFRELKRPMDALACHDRALELRPGHAESHNHRGNALRSLHRHEEALGAYRLAIELAPGFASAWSNRAVALRELDRTQEALASCERALALQPQFPEAHCNYGNLLRDLGRHAEALARYRRAVELAPNLAAAQFSLGQCLLLQGDLAGGWQGYEWRWKEEQQAGEAPEFGRPLWLGDEPLAGRTILLHAEQGLGDTLQFCRYVKRVAALGARVILQVQAPLAPLLAGLEGVAAVLPRGAPLPDFDCHCPLLSLPLAFRTTLVDIPAEVPYVRADPQRVASWHARLGPRNGPRIGLAWSGRATHRNDRNRSIPLARMLPLLDTGPDFVSLQREVRPTEAGLLASRPELRHFGDQLMDFAETAALIASVDLVISVDTSVAHLAGAMGKTVWILLPFDPDWRWLLDRTDSPWYPTATLFRQPTPGDWANVLDEIGDRLRTVSRTNRAAGAP